MTLETNNLHLENGHLYIVETPSEEDAKLFLRDCEFSIDRVLHYHKIEFDYLLEEYKNYRILDLFSLFNLNFEMLPDSIDTGLKIQDLSVFFLRCLDFLIKSKSFHVVTSLEALSKKSREQYIYFLKRASKNNINFPTICLDYSSTTHDITCIKIIDLTD